MEMMMKTLKLILLLLISFPTIGLSQKPPREKADLLIRGGTVVTMDADRRIIEGGAVAIRGERIVAVGPAAEVERQFQPTRTIDARSKLVMPGLINTHTHAPMTLLRGIRDDVELMVWLQQYIWPAEGKNVSPEFVKWGTLLGCWEMIQSGTTTFADMYFFEDEVAAAAKQAGMRAICAATAMDIPVPGQKTADEGLKAAEAFLKKWRGDSLIVPAVGPHSAYTCSPETLLRAKRLADQYQAPLLIHVAESPSEMKTVQEKYGASTVAHLNKIGFLGRNILAAHAVWLSDEDIQILKDKDVGVAHCPQSNMKLASGVSPVPKLLRAGVRVGLGTDGTASNNDLNLFEEMDTACKLQNITSMNPTALTAQEAVEMATIGGARALHLEDQIGSLEVGKRADLIILTLDQPNEIPLYNVYSHLVYAIKASDVEDSIINGKVVMENRRLLTLDTRAMRQKTQEFRERVLKSVAR
jgi:5-methylthioadenosine/S-adenosylhomocysteine deaminase